MQKRAVARNTTDNEDQLNESPNTTTINVNTPRDTIKPRKTSLLRKIVLALIIILFILLLLAVSREWLSSSVSNAHMFDAVRDLYHHEEEVHPVLLPPTTTAPPKPFWNVSVIVAKSSHLMDIVKSLSQTTSPTFRVQVLISGSITNATITKLHKKYRDQYLSLSTVRRRPAIGETLLIIPENLSVTGTSTKWLAEMCSQFKKNDKLIALGTRIIYKTDTTPRYIYSAGLDVAYRKLDTPVLFHRFNGLNEFDERVMTKQSNSQTKFGNVGLVAVDRYGMMVRNNPYTRRILFQLDTVDHLVSNNEDIDQDRILCLSAMQENPKESVIMYYPIRDFAFAIDKQRITDNALQLQEQSSNEQAIEDSLLIQFMQSIINQRLGSFANTRIVWDFGAGSCTGWFMEAVNFVTALENRVPIRIITGKHDMCEGLPGYVIGSLDRLIDRTFENITVFITHKPPDRYPKFPYNGLVSISGYPEYIVGRSMYESTAIPDGWGDHCNNKVDEVWVPSKFLQQAFIEGGTKQEKVFFIPEPIDHYFYDPATVLSPFIKKSSPSSYDFLAVFKWEERKAPELLLEAYFKEFKYDKDVTLHLLTYLFMDYDGHSKQRIYSRVMEIAESLNMTKIPRVNVISQVVDTFDMPRLYASVDAFVLPSRGEGWGMPYMEAMTMGLPTIATNFGGQLEFMNDQNSYLVDVTMKSVSEYDKREQWADAKITDLRSKMRYLFQNREKGRDMGKRAREYIVKRFSQKELADIVLKNLKRINNILEKNRNDPAWIKKRKQLQEKKPSSPKWGSYYDEPIPDKKSKSNSWQSPSDDDHQKQDKKDTQWDSFYEQKPPSDDDKEAKILEEFAKGYEKFLAELNNDPKESSQKLRDLTPEQILNEIKASIKHDSPSTEAPSSTTTTTTTTTTKAPGNVAIKIN
jgi:glycosyltransferase involved in cell wall biosynthesis